MMRSFCFKEFLKFFWLRPENALLVSVRIEAYQSTLKYFGDGSNTIDVSCGDGVFSFIVLSGTLSNKTDMFRSLDLTSERKGNFDSFDAFSDEYLVEVEKDPNKSYEFGIDWKKSLLSKAGKLNWYGNLIEHDNNVPLPFDNERMKYVYSNSLHWVENYKNHLNGLARITSKGGKIVLHLKTTNTLEFRSDKYLPFMGKKFHEVIDAGRLSNWKAKYSRDEIVALLGKIPDIKIVNISPIYGDIMSIIWDIGLRPLFRPLAKMANSLSDDERVSVKEEWNQIFVELFMELLKTYEANDNSAVEHLVILEKT